MRAYGPILGVQLAGNALLIGLIYYYLGTGEGSIAALLWSVVVALFIIALACWLQGAAFVYFDGAKPGLGTAFRAALRRVAPLMLAAAIIALLYLLLAMWANYSGKPAFQIASWLTLKMRKPVRPASVMGVFGVALWLVRWMVLPVLMLPLIAAIAKSGRLATAQRRAWYWIAVPVLLVCAFWVPAKLWGWVPPVHGFTWEMVSFLARGVVGYVLFVAAWTAVVWVTVAPRLRPRAGETSPDPA